MEYIPASYAPRVGMRCPARVTSVEEDFVAFRLDLTHVAPGRSPFVGAGLGFDRTVAPEKVRRLQPGEWVEVVLIDVAGAEPHDWVTVSLPADPAWLTWNDETVRHLARRIRQTGDTGLLPILADALEDAGCADAAILEHCRSRFEDGERSWLVELLATQA